MMSGENQVKNVRGLKVIFKLSSEHVGIKNLTFQVELDSSMHGIRG